VARRPRRESNRCCEQRALLRTDESSLIYVGGGSQSVSHRERADGGASRSTSSSTIQDKVEKQRAAAHGLAKARSCASSTVAQGLGLKHCHCRRPQPIGQRALDAPPEGASARCRAPLPRPPSSCTTGPRSEMSAVETGADMLATWSSTYCCTRRAVRTRHDTTRHDQTRRLGQPHGCIWLIGASTLHPDRVNRG
jgi:hypothetical protein